MPAVGWWPTCCRGPLNNTRGLPRSSAAQHATRYAAAPPSIPKQVRFSRSPPPLLVSNKGDSFASICWFRLRFRLQCNKLVSMLPTSDTYSYCLWSIRAAMLWVWLIRAVYRPTHPLAFPKIATEMKILLLAAIGLIQTIILTRDKEKGTPMATHFLGCCASFLPENVKQLQRATERGDNGRKRKWAHPTPGFPHFSNIR